MRRCFYNLLLIIIYIQRSNAFCNGKSVQIRQTSSNRRRTVCVASKTSNDDNDSTNKEEESQPFDSLDIVLQRARKRNQLALLLGKLQASLDRRILPFLSIGDCLIVLAAVVLLDATAFAIGLVIGKATLVPLRKLLIQQGGGRNLIKFLDLYPAILAILLDQVLD